METPRAARCPERPRGPRVLRRPPAFAPTPSGGGAPGAARGGGPERGGEVGAAPCRGSAAVPGAPPDVADIPRPRFCGQCSPSSEGSIGHPRFCRSGCVHVLAGTRCPRGPDCTWCHDPSCKTRRHLDKRSRQLFREMDDLSKIRTVWPVLKSKMDEVGLGGVATRALEKWRCDITSMPEFAGHPQDVRLPSQHCLERLRRFRLTDLCACPILPECVAERTERLLMELRAFERTRIYADDGFTHVLCHVGK
ncbi:unnamed protein product [Prorocentrum cordatum]|uniref:C3H1-type domain-containing protein n=1 Tax=Prorocentrum cordatum TaxID=2364126 RepID=A0ABN9VMT8_9DINO|nr:unnamed protein product [Polarella glacialis]